jgi:virginiamycin B lyase
MLNASNGKTTTYATSRASPQIYGVNETNNVPEGAYTLPYWIEKGFDGSLWFNEHEGNKIARFQPSDKTLYEYWIPTQNRLWGNCPPTSRTCGVANALQFSSGVNSQKTPMLKPSSCSTRYNKEDLDSAEPFNYVF